MTANRKELVLNAFDGKKVDRIPSGFWFHFLDDEIHADAFVNPQLTDKVLAGELKYIDEFQPDFIKIMTDGFFPYRNDLIKTAQTPAELAKIEPLADDDPFFTQQIAYAKAVTDHLGDSAASFYNIFCAATIFKFMRAGEPTENEALLSKWLLEDGESVKKAFDVISADLAKLAQRIVTEGGATGIYFSLQNILGEGITKEIYRKYISDGEKLVLAKVKEVSDYNILHICGYAGHHNDLSYYTDYDVKAVNWAAVVENIPLEEGRKYFGNKTILGGFGNLDSELLYKGSKEEIQAETRRLIANAGTQGVILGADCTVPRDIDWKHFAWVREAGRI